MFGRGVVVTELHKGRDVLLVLDVGWYSVETGRKELEWRCCRVSLIDIAVNCGARRSWSVAGRGTAAVTRDGVLAVGVC